MHCKPRQIVNFNTHILNATKLNFEVSDKISSSRTAILALDDHIKNYLLFVH